MDTRELIILVLGFAIVAVISRGLFVALKARRGQVRLAIDKNIPQDVDLEALELAELPNGGARVVNRGNEFSSDAEESFNQDPQFPTSSDFSDIDDGDSAEPIPVLMDAVSVHDEVEHEHEHEEVEEEPYFSEQAPRIDDSTHTDDPGSGNVDYSYEREYDNDYKTEGVETEQISDHGNAEYEDEELAETVLEAEEDSEPDWGADSEFTPTISTASNLSDLDQDSAEADDSCIDDVLLAEDDSEHQTSEVDAGYHEANDVHDGLSSVRPDYSDNEYQNDEQTLNQAPADKGLAEEAQHTIPEFEEYAVADKVYVDYNAPTPGSESNETDIEDVLLSSGEGFQPDHQRSEPYGMEPDEQDTYGSNDERNHDTHEPRQSGFGAAQYSAEPARDNDDAIGIANHGAVSDRYEPGQDKQWSNQYGEQAQGDLVHDYVQPDDTAQQGDNHGLDQYNAERNPIPSEEEEDGDQGYQDQYTNEPDGGAGPDGNAESDREMSFEEQLGDFSFSAGDRIGDSHPSADRPATASPSIEDSHRGVDRHEEATIEAVVERPGETVAQTYSESNTELDLEPSVQDAAVDIIRDQPLFSDQQTRPSEVEVNELSSEETVFQSELFDYENTALENDSDEHIKASLEETEIQTESLGSKLRGIVPKVGATELLKGFLNSRRTAQSSEADETLESGAEQADLNDTAIDQPIDHGEVLIMHVMASEGYEFVGDSLVHALFDCGLEFGDMDIFHRKDSVSGKTLYSIANAVNPGTFDFDAMSSFRTRGISLFLALPSPVNNLQAFDDMLTVSKQLCAQLQGELKDEDRNGMTAQTIEHYRQRIRDFELQRLRNMSARS